MNNIHSKWLDHQVQQNALHGNVISTMPSWLIDFRKRHWDEFLKNGLPSKKDERWKYADLTFLADNEFSLEGASPRPAASTSLRTTEGASSRSAASISRRPAACPRDPGSIDSHRAFTGSRGQAAGRRDALAAGRYDVLAAEQRDMLAAKISETPISLVFLNGQFAPHLSEINKLPTNIIACQLREAWQHHPELLKNHWIDDIDTKKYPFATLNAGTFTDGLFFYVPDHCILSTPLHFLFIQDAAAKHTISHPQLIMIIGEHSNVTIVEEHATEISANDDAYLLNIMTTISIQKEATLTYYKIQQANPKAIHIAHTFIQQAADSHVTLTHFSFGGLFARDEINIKLQGLRAACETAGLYSLHQENQYIDHHIDIDHAASHTESQMLYKGILHKKARAVFNGRVHVTKGVQKISAYQANHNLLLSQEAEIYSKPELEIYADDVKCKHGATIGQIDEAALFYLRSRGIAFTDAMAILLDGFASEIMQRVLHADIRSEIEERWSCLNY